MSDQIQLIVVLGPTASGKTRLGVELARALDGEIISADSRQVFRGLDIGSGKDLDEYGDVPYHLIDILEPSEEYSAFHFQRDFFRCYAEICARGKQPILVGGTGLYLEAVLRGYQFAEVPQNAALRDTLAEQSVEQLQQQLLALKPDLHNTTDLLVRPRLVRAIEIATAEQNGAVNVPDYPQLDAVLFGIHWPRPVLRKRIATRLEQRLQQGMLDEVKCLLKAGIAHEKLDYFGLEYRYLSQHLKGELNYNDMHQKLRSAICQFAKRQDTWFRRMQRNGDTIHWIEGSSDNHLAQALSVLRQLSTPQG